jgi:hypothetical protein
VLALNWAPTVPFPWPNAPTEQPVFTPDPANTVTSTLIGAFTMEIHFNRDTSGYGHPGVLETTQGQAAAIEGTPFAISDFATPCATPQTALAVAPEPDPLPAVTFVSAGPTEGTVDLFNQHASGVLHLKARFQGRRIPGCDQPAYTTNFDQGTTPLPLTYDGDFHISPAITSDGRLRLGLLTIDPTVPQPSNFGLIHVCTTDPATVTPPSDACGDQAYPARLSFQKLTAEFIIGDALPPTASQGTGP